MYLFICCVQCVIVFEKKDGLTAEELEQREVSKRKMLGNIKFIGTYENTQFLNTYVCIYALHVYALHMHASCIPHDVHTYIYLYKCQAFNGSGLSI